MFDLTFLGTSASVPSADRNHPALLMEAGGHRIMVDCGEGTQRQLLRSGAGFRRLDRLLLTHGHFDHVLGIPGLFSTQRLRQSTDVMTIHGSKGLEFRAVHLPAIATRYMPTSQQANRCPPPAGLTRLAMDRQDHEAEEECLFFVALSRAQDHLSLSCRCRPEATAS